MYAMAATSRALMERFRKQRELLIQRAYALSSACNADVYIIVLQHNKWHSYKAIGEEVGALSLESVL